MDIIEKYHEAGRIAHKVKEESREYVKEGANYLELANFVESSIINEGAQPAFPVNISVNNISAHYTPPIDETSVFNKGDYVKVDLGAHVDGYIADTAYTVKVGEPDDDLVKASKDALDAAIEMVKPGAMTNKIGGVIDETIRSYGFKPIENLTGHGLDQYITHSSPTMPNYDNGHGVALKEGDAIAIEPFATDGGGRVIDEEIYLIFAYIVDRPVRLPLARTIMTNVKKNYYTLPFAQRWLSEKYTKRKTEFALKYLVRSSSLYGYSVLKEIDGGNVSQCENSMIVTSEGADVFT